MTLIDILGWVATSVVVISFTVKDMKRLRIINSTGTLLWLTYGGLRLDYPLLSVNALILIAHLVWFDAERRKGSRR